MPSDIAQSNAQHAKAAFTRLATTSTAVDSYAGVVKRWECKNNGHMNATIEQLMLIIDLKARKPVALPEMIAKAADNCALGRLA